MSEKIISRCGIVCSDCYAFSSNCNGCDSVSGKPYWTEHVGIEICPIYKCSVDKGFDSCGDCQKLPCQMFFDQKDPSMSMEEHEKLIKSRTDILKNSR